MRVFELLRNRARSTVGTELRSLVEATRRFALFVRPINFGLRIVLLRQQTVHHAGALGFFGIENGLHLDAGFFSKSLRIGSENTWSSLT